MTGAPQVSAIPLVSIVSPVYNEEAVISTFVQRLTNAIEPLASKYRFDILLVDDGSRDGTLEALKRLAAADKRLRVVELRRNSGQTAALQAGFDHVHGDIIITMDADLQHFPEEIPQFLAHIEDGWDVVCGWRHERRENIVRRWPSLVANKLLRWISGLAIHDIGTTYRAYRADVIRDIRLLGDNHRFIPMFAQNVGARIIEIPIRNIERPTGKSHYGLRRTTNVLFDMVFLYFFMRYLDRPIRVFGWIALYCFLVGGAISALLLVIWLSTGTPVVREHSGWFMLSMVLLLGALQVLLTGLIMEMVVRLYFPGRDKAPYHIRHIWDETTLQPTRQVL